MSCNCNVTTRCPSKSNITPPSTLCKSAFQYGLTDYELLMPMRGTCYTNNLVPTNLLIKLTQVDMAFNIHKKTKHCLHSPEKRRREKYVNKIKMLEEFCFVLGLRSCVALHHIKTSGVLFGLWFIWVDLAVTQYNARDPSWRNVIRFPCSVSDMVIYWWRRWFK